MTDHVPMSLVLLALVGAGAVSARLNRPKLEGRHRRIIGVWLGLLGLGIFIWWLGPGQDEGGGWFPTWWGAVIGSIALVEGAVVMALVALVAKAVSADSEIRSAVLVGTPLLILAWLYVGTLHSQLF